MWCPLSVQFGHLLLPDKLLILFGGIWLIIFSIVVIMKLNQILEAVTKP